MRASGLNGHLDVTVLANLDCTHRFRSRVSHLIVRVFPAIEHPHHPSGKGLIVAWLHLGHLVLRDD